MSDPRAELEGCAGCLGTLLRLAAWAYVLWSLHCIKRDVAALQPPEQPAPVMEPVQPDDEPAELLWERAG